MLSIKVNNPYDLLSMNDCFDAISVVLKYAKENHLIDDANNFDKQSFHLGVFDDKGHEVCVKVYRKKRTLYFDFFLN